MSLRSTSLRDQRTLFEELQVIVSQLRQKGEHVDSQWLQKQVLSKFPEQLQRKVLEKKHAMTPDASFSMDTLSEIFGRCHFDGCMYCNESHKSSACTKYKTPQQRSQYLREHKLCLICASPQHATSRCKNRMCFACNGAHHTSCCFKTSQDEQSFAKQRPTSTPPAKKTSASKDLQKVKATTKINHLNAPQDDQDTTICELQSAQEDQDNVGTFLPTGELTVMDPKSKKLRKVAVLLDTGAELSFIDNSLAEELGLPTLEETTLRLHTFGSEQIQEELCRKVPLETWDEERNPISLQLLTHRILTKSLVPPPVLKEDLEYVRRMNLPIRLSERQLRIKLLILLGCDQLWSLIRVDQSQLTLPSGLHLLPFGTFTHWPFTNGTQYCPGLSPKQAATTHYHLDQYENDSILVKEIKENLYVDNLLLTADTVEDAVKVYSRTKEMFNALNMNIREFVSNEQDLMSAIASHDKSAELTPNVLGIKWDSTHEKYRLRL
ncbi:hypothetical protein RB195_024965 [Necator americanus]|uniref:Tas retrotransposon peptidase A16 n=1 Tax=Necator americanus TaxID=51031 RepID=A0ABR1EQB5_NECAM